MSGIYKEKKGRSQWLRDLGGGNGEESENWAEARCVFFLHRGQKKGTANPPTLRAGSGAAVVSSRRLPSRYAVIAVIITGAVETLASTTTAASVQATSAAGSAAATDRDVDASLPGASVNCIIDARSVGRLDSRTFRTGQ